MILLLLNGVGLSQKSPASFSTISRLRRVFAGSPKQHLPVQGFYRNKSSMVQLRGGKKTDEATNGDHSANSASKLPLSSSLSVLKSPPTSPTMEINKIPYTNCKTRILNLRHIPHIPVGKDTPEFMYRQIYHDYINSTRHPSPPHPDTLGRGLARNEKKKEDQRKEARLLRSAISSLTTGIAPPVAFPTETVYGLGADATNAASIAGIFAAKGRPGDNPLIVHVSSVAHLERCLGGSEAKSAIPEVYKELLTEFWPGPLTVLIPIPEEGKGVKFAPNVHPGQETIGFRMPKSAYARFLIAVADRPIAAPSANSSGKPSPTSARHVKDDLNGKINFILDGGECDVGVESTVVDGLCDPPLILRPGGLSKGDLRSWGKKNNNVWQHVENGWEYKHGVKRKRDNDESGVNGNKIAKRLENGDVTGNMYDSPATQTPKNEHSDLEMEGDSSSAPRAPGMKYKHYAPQGRMFLFESDRQTSEGPDLNYLYTELSGLLDARNMQPDSRTRDLGLLFKAKAKGGTGIPKRVQAIPHDPVHNVNIGVLTSTFWPGLPDLFDAWPDLFPKWWDATANIKCFPGTDFQKIQVNLDFSDDKLPRRRANVYQVALGRDAKSIAKKLFAGLRLCDSLDCEWIFVEAPSKSAVQEASNERIGEIGGGEEDEDEFETVLERMRKAASEIVHCRVS